MAPAKSFLFINYVITHIPVFVVFNSMTICKLYKDFEVELFNDTLYDPNSRDNPYEYGKIYSDSQYDDYVYLTRHGIHLKKDEDLITSALVFSSGGTTGIHKTCSLIDENRLLICCGDATGCIREPDGNHLPVCALHCNTFPPLSALTIRSDNDLILPLD